MHPKEPDVKFLALSVSDAAEDVIGTIRAGARGYVTKSITGDELVAAIKRWRTATRCSRRGWPDSSSTRLPAPSRRASTTTSTGSPPASAVLRLIARGYAYKEIAKELFISVKTVETHVSAVLRKLQLSTGTNSHPLGHRPPPGLSRPAPRNDHVHHLAGTSPPCRPGDVRTRLVMARSRYPAAMDVVYKILVVLHFLGLASLIGGWLVAACRR